MPQASYHHQPSFPRRYVRSVLKMMGLPKKPSIEAEIFGQVVLDEQVVNSINGEILTCNWHHGREGRVVVLESTLSRALVIQMAPYHAAWSLRGFLVGQDNESLIAPPPAW